MAWNKEEQSEVFLSFWSRRGAECPTCKAEVRCDYTGVMGGDYRLSVTCPRGCDSVVFHKSFDPFLPEFRRFTDAEVEAICEDHFSKRRTPICPVDGTPLDMTEQPYMGGGMFLKSWCPRCAGNSKTNYPLKKD